ncbi:MAG TPA: c-type cytochrome [Polyangia bacterium]
MAVFVVATSACNRPRFREPLVLAGGREIPAATLNEGRVAYMHYCYACHGENGDGRGPSSPAMRPPPRDLTQGIFKFGGVPAGELPTDADLEALIRNGLAGTPMLPWDISERERTAIVQYIKTFSPRWKTETPGEPVKPEVPDPWSGREAEAVARGEMIYHLSGVELDPATSTPKTVLAGCNACHPSYLDADALAALSNRILKRPIEVREKPLRPALKESEFQVGDTKVGFLPSDFLFHTMKNGSSPTALFRTIAAGIGGTAMPTWKGSVKDEDLWALVHYVRHLLAMRDTPAGRQLRERLAAASPGTISPPGQRPRP